jgi:hypothetical protein
MPFDGTNLALSARDLLQAAASASGLRPIDRDALGRHKADQILRHPAAWAYKHNARLQLGQAIVMLAGMIVVMALFSAQQYPWGLSIGLMTLGVAALPILLPVRGPAEWTERDAGDLRAVHPAVRGVALRLKQELPEVRFYLGELFQDRIRLDPYLLAEYRGAKIVLGIWDGDEVIASA